MTISTDPQASWVLKTDTVNPCDTTLLPHHQPIKELCMSWSHTLRPPSLTWLLKMLCQNPLESLGFLKAWATIPLHDPALNLSLLQIWHSGLFCLTVCQAQELVLTLWLHVTYGGGVRLKRYQGMAFKLYNKCESWKILSHRGNDKINVFDISSSILIWDCFM